MIEKLKWILPRLPLPMLALSASYGVYQFALLFVPQWVAIAQAAAFELTYVSLASIETETESQRKRATAISLGAVAVSVLYNWLAGFFHRNPESLIGLSNYQEAGLAFLHGAPLAIVAYLVADLLLHKNQQRDASPLIEEPIHAPATPALPLPKPALGSLIEELKQDTAPIAKTQQRPAKAPQKRASNGITKRSRIRSALDEHGDLKDSMLYEMFPDISQSGVRNTAKEWRDEQKATMNGHS